MDKEKMESELALELELGEKCMTLKERILFFNRNFPNGSIQSFIQSEATSDRYLARAVIHPSIVNEKRAFTAYARCDEDIITAENIAVLRALTMMGIGTMETVGEFDSKVRILPPVAPVEPKSAI